MAGASRTSSMPFLRSIAPLLLAAVFLSTVHAQTCSDPSPSVFCNRKPAADTQVTNDGNIDLVLFKIQGNGRMDKKHTLAPGDNVTLDTCVKQLWQVESLCEQCLEVFEITTTSTAAMSLSYPSEEPNCLGDPTCDDTTPSVGCRRSTADTTVENTGNIDLKLYRVNKRGASKLMHTLAAGESTPLKTCSQQVWTVKTTCGDCVDAFRIASDSQTTLSLSYPSEEATCPPASTNVTCSDLSGSVACRRASSKMTVQNDGNIDLQLYKVNPNKSQKLKATVKAKESTALSVCQDQVWAVKTLCGLCVGAFRVGSESAIQLSYPSEEAACSGTPTCSNLLPSVSCDSTAPVDSTVRNEGGIDLRLYRITEAAEKVLEHTVQAGTSITLSACEGQVWMVETLCGSCVDAFRIPSIADTEFTLNYPTAETACPAPTTCENLSSSTSCRNFNVRKFVQNSGNIDLRLYRISAKGKQVLKHTVTAGTSVQLASCENQLWKVETLCGKCVDVFKVSSTNIEALKLSYPLEEAACVPDPTCDNPAPSIWCAAKDPAKTTIRNNGNIDLSLFKVQGSGATVLKYILAAGDSILPESCEGQLWVVKTLCDKCVDVIKIASAEETTLDLRYPQEEKTCPNVPGAATCEDPGESSSSCGGSDDFDVTIQNGGRIIWAVFKVGTTGKLSPLDYKIRPGGSMTVKTCKGQRFMVKTTCGECVEVFEAESAGERTIVDDDAEKSCPAFKGRWSNFKTWKVIPVGIANIPGSGGKLLGFAARSPIHYLQGESRYKTEAQIYDPKTGSLEEADLDGHDIFCAGLTLLPDGTLFAGGGGTADNGYKVSTYHPTTGWTRHVDMEVSHWYGTAIVTTNNRIMVSLGEDFVTSQWLPINNFPEISGPNFDFGATWTRKGGIDYRGRHAEKTHWYPQQLLMGNGKILHYGTQNKMYVISTGGDGSITYVGKRNTERDEDEAWGATSVYYEAGKVLCLGGIEGWDGDRAPNTSVLKRAIVVDFRNPKSIRSYKTDDLIRYRAFPNAIPLPSGEVVVFGGKNNTKQWSDEKSVFSAELWNPVTGKWTLLSAQKRPRNYHATAILLPDGRVFSGGGGLCGSCGINHLNSEIFSPPYLFTPKGKLRSRPVIKSAPRTIAGNKKFSIEVSGAGAADIDMVSVVKQAATTHGISTDMRRLVLDITNKRRISSAVYKYTVKAPYNSNDLTRGFYFLFVLTLEGTPSVAAEVQVV